MDWFIKKLQPGSLFLEERSARCHIQQTSDHKEMQPDRASFFLSFSLRCLCLPHCFIHGATRALKSEWSREKRGGPVSSFPGSTMGIRSGCVQLLLSVHVQHADSVWILVNFFFPFLTTAGPLKASIILTFSMSFRCTQWTCVCSDHRRHYVIHVVLIWRAEALSLNSDRFTHVPLSPLQIELGFLLS